MRQLNQCCSTLTPHDICRSIKDVLNYESPCRKLYYYRRVLVLIFLSLVLCLSTHRRVPVLSFSLSLSLSLSLSPQIFCPEKYTNTSCFMAFPVTEFTWWFWPAGTKCLVMWGVTHDPSLPGQRSYIKVYPVTSDFVRKVAAKRYYFSEIVEISVVTVEGRLW